MAGTYLWVQNAMSITKQPSEKVLVVWGGRKIAEAIERTPKQAFNLMEAGKLPGAKKVGGRWCLNLAVFHASFSEQK